MKQDVDTWICPDCGAEVKVGAPGCPRCLAAEKRARSRKRRKRRTASMVGKHSESDGLSLPDDDFNYDEFVKREFGRRAHQRIGISPLWWWTAVVLLSLMIGALLGGKLFRWLGW